MDTQAENHAVAVRQVEATEAPQEATIVETANPEDGLENDFNEQETPEQTIANPEDDYSIPTTDAGEYDFESMTEAQLDQVIADLEGAEGDSEAEYTLPDKFKDVDSLVQSYNSLEAKMGNFVKAPETYNVEGVDMNDPVMTELSATARELNMSNDALSAIVNKFNEVNGQMDTMDTENEMAQLGSHAQSRIDNINNYIDGNIAPHLQDSIREMATSASSIEALEAMIGSGRQSTPTQAPAPAASTDPKDLLWAKDNYGNLKMETDSNYAALVQQRMEAYYGS